MNFPNLLMMQMGDILLSRQLIVDAGTSCERTVSQSTHCHCLSVIRERNRIAWKIICRTSINALPNLNPLAWTIQREDAGASRVWTMAVSTNRHCISIIRERHMIAWKIVCRFTINVTSKLHPIAWTIPPEDAGTSSVWIVAASTHCHCISVIGERNRSA